MSTDEIDVDFELADDLKAEFEYEFAIETEEDTLDGDSVEMLIKYFDEYFDNKEYYCGGEIPHNMIYNEENYRLVLNTSMEEGIDQMHFIFEQNPPPSDFSNILGWGPSRISELLVECASKRIPKQFAPGLILIYLDVCEGLRYKEQESAWSLWD